MNCCVPETVRLAWLGLTLVAGVGDELVDVVPVVVVVGVVELATSDIAALAVLVESARLVAMIVIVWLVVIVAGAPYSPLAESVPTEGTIDH